MFLIPRWSSGQNCCCSVAKLCPTLCDFIDFSTPSCSVLHCPLSPGVCSNSCPLSWWCYLTLSHLLLPPFSFCLQSFPASQSFSLSQLFTSGGQSIGASASATVVKNLPAKAWIWSLILEDSTCCEAAKLIYHNYWSLRALEHILYNKWSHHKEKPWEEPLLTTTRKSLCAAIKTQNSQ